MFMLLGKKDEIPSSEITPETLYYGRREWLAAAGLAGLGAVLNIRTLGASQDQDRWPQGRKGPFDTDEKVNTFREITTYNNFYEFGTDKADPSRESGRFKPLPWTVTVGGLVNKPATYALEDILKGATIEDRIYRMRCVEGWSMVIPWRGFQLSHLIKKAGPSSGAKYVAFETVMRPEQMPGQRRDVLEWPYVEGLTLAEALHPLTLLSTGLYGKDLLNQNGAPLRLVVPWKYGFKSIKSIVKITVTDTEPPTSWNIAAPNEYGFFSNVNPDVNHPRWSQRTERRIGEFGKRKTLLLNGYADQVGDLYAGMDLKTFY
jgi:sulfoxide reductase catalytic subunit YedY